MLKNLWLILPIGLATCAFTVWGQDVPKMIEPPQPGDATVQLLSDQGINLFWSHQGGRCDWHSEAGVLTSTPDGHHSNHIVSDLHFQDAEIHVEFCLPAEGPGNSGLYLHGSYELQIINSTKQPEVTENDIGSLYGFAKPLLNAGRGPGEWQTYDIIFRAPRRDPNGVLIQPGEVTAWLNGQLIHQRTQFTEPKSGFRPFLYRTNRFVQELAQAYRETQVGPLFLQDHGNPVKFRNIWIRPLDDRAFRFSESSGVAWPPPRQTIAAEQWPELKTALTNRLTEILPIENSPGVSLAVVFADGKSIEIVRGLADRDLPDPLPNNPRMLAGSVGKLFVSATVLQLVGENKIDLDEKASHYLQHLDWFSRLPNHNTLTVRSLLNHTSGLPRYIFQEKFLSTVKSDPYRSWSPQECLEMIFDQPAIHPVGQGWGYSDTNYQILGLIVEQVTGNSYYAELERRFIKPLALTDTLPATQPELPGLVQGHVGENNFFSLPAKTVALGRYAMNPQFEWCGGGLLTSSRDLAKFAAHLYSGQLLKKEVQDQLTRAVAFRDGQPADQGYGLGAFVWQSPSGPSWGHSGIMPGYLTHVEYDARQKFAIALQFNHDSGLGRKHHEHAQKLAEVVRHYLAD